MYLKAIELEQVGTFARAVRIDDISSGLNVLAGANELGKSTVLRGLMALFTEQHRSTKQSIRNLRPYVGGAPFLACTYEHGGQSWRLEKRFLSAQMASLERLDGSEQHQGADAENRLADMMGDGSALGANWPLLWVGQGAAGFDVPLLNDGARQSLGQLLSAQAENTAGVGVAQAVLRAVESELGQLVTEKSGKARKNGTYFNLMAEQTKLVSDLEEAKRKASDAEQRLARLTELQRTCAELQDPDVQAALEAQAAELKQHLEGAAEARQKVQQLSERVAFLENQKKQREATLADYDEGLRELQLIAAALTAADDELVEIAARKASLADQMQARDAALQASAQRETELIETIEQRRIVKEQVSQRQRLQHLSKQCDRLAEISSAIATSELELKELDWPDHTISNLRRAQSEVEQASARIQATAPRVRVSYSPGISRGFVVAGEDIADGAEVSVSEPLIIEVEGIGRIAVMPSDTDDERSAVVRQHDAAMAKLNACLVSMGANDVDQAEAREERRHALSQERQLLLSELQVLAPDGEEKLLAERDQLRAAVTGHQSAVASASANEHDAFDNAVSEEDVVAELRAVRTIIADTNIASEVLKAERNTIDQRRAEIAAELRVRRTRHDELRMKYEPDEGSGERREDLVALVHAAEQQLNAAVRERLAVQEVALTEGAILELQQKLADLHNRLKSRGEQLAATLQEMRHVEGMLARDFEDGGGEEAGELQGRVDEIGERLRACERHIAALRLLSSHLRSETTQRRDAIARPLARRMNALAARLWLDAEVPLNSDLVVDGLVRGGQRESTDQVSSGTREQVAVLARLAYAGLLAEGDEALPVILDDPLVYSDDNRLEALFGAMADAAKAHQIIVLTCHERSFEPLVSRFGATRLSIEERSAVPAA